MRYVLHLGLAKTGSTALRIGFFPALPGVELSVRENDGPARVLQRVRYSAKDAAALPGGEPAYLDALAAKFRASHRPTTKDILVISDETIIGPHLDGIPAVVGRIKFLCPDAKIVMVLRDPMEMLRAIYRQEMENLVWKVSAGQSYVDDIAPFDSYLRAAIQYGYSGTLGYIRYNEMIAAFENAFGATNCLFLGFRHFCDAPDRFMQKLTRFIGVPDFSPTSLPRENVSTKKLTTLMDTAARAGYSIQQQDQIRQNYTEQPLGADVQSYYERYIALHAAEAMDRISRQDHSGAL